MLRLMKRLDIPDEFFSIDTINTRLDAAWELHHTIRKDGPKFRENFLDGLAEAQAAAKNIPTATALRNIKHREAERYGAGTRQ